MSEEQSEGRLPPPAFPPGMRRRVYTNSVRPAADRPEPGEDGFISPDDPLPGRPDPMSLAFIQPDEPLPERKIELLEQFQSATSGIDPDDEGVVVGMDLDAHLEPGEVVSGGDPHVIEVLEAVAKLANAVGQRGEAGLRTTPEMSRFEATLRAYCVGYLAGRRAEEPPPPIVEEPLPTDG